MTRALPSLTGLAALAALLLLAGLFAACDDSELNQLGAEGANQVTVEVRLGDYWLATADGAPLEPDDLFGTVPAHSDVTFHVTNEGAVEHSLGVYASDDTADLLVATALLAPGEATEVRFHFHDPLVVVLRDDAYPDEMHARLEVAH